MAKPKAPASPDYAGAAKAQGVANIDAARTTAQLSNPNMITPYGNQTVSYQGDIPTVTLGKARTFSVGATGSIQKREREEKQHAKPFHYVLSGDPARVPAREELEDFWFTIDYKINYEPILTMTDERRLSKKEAMLAEICERMTTDNALGLLFLGIAQYKRGKTALASLAAQSARRYLEESDFWRLRFAALQIDEHLLWLERGLS